MPTSTATHLAHLSAPDLGIVAFYLIAITLFGLRFAKKSKQERSLKSYFLADNAIPWWAISLSIVSAETSTLTIISIPGVAFAGNLGFLQIVLGYMLGRIVVALLFLPKYFRGEMLTAYQLIDRRFGATLHKITAGLFLLTRAAAEGVRVFAISIVVSIAIGTGDTASIAIISALTLLYTFEGGMRAVIWTDVVQMALYVAGTIVALITLGHDIPGGWSHIHAVAAPLGKFHWLDFTLNLTTTYTFWAGILGGTFLTMASHGTDQLMVQRLLAARNLRESRLALLSSGAVIFLQFTLFLLIGIGLFVFYSGSSATFKTNDYIFPTYIVQQMPHGIAGLLVAAILAAAMSNLSAALNSLASTTVIDFYLPFRSRTKRVPQVSHLRPGMEPPQPSPENTTLISRLSTIFWAIILFLIALYSIQHGGRGHVVETGLSIASVAYGSLLGVFLLGTLTRYATQTGAIIGMIFGFALNLFLWQMPTTGDTGFTWTTPAATRFIPWSAFHVAFTWYVIIGAVATFAIGSLFSLIFRAPRRAVALILLVAVALGAPSFAQSAKGGVSSEARPSSSTTQNIVILSAVEGPAVASQPQTSTPQYDFTPVSTLINTAIAEHKLPGAVLLIGHNDKIVFEQAYGLRKLAGEPGLDGKPSPAEPMTLDTIFDMASLTKVIVTTTAVLQLYEQGKLDLDAPVAKYLPEFASTTGNAAPALSNPTLKPVILSGASRPYRDAQSKDPDAARTPATARTFQPPNLPSAAAWKSQITIRQLLTHYSGLPEDVSLKDDWGLKAPDKAEGICRAMASIPYGPPGQTFKYSDINFITLGALVEKVTGQTLDIYAFDHIFRPLTMSRTSFHPYCDCGQGFLPPYGLGAYLGPMKPTEICNSNICPSWRGENTAPTAHDNEGTPATNPNYDHLLRGTVHDPTTRRMGGVAGHAGLFSTAEDMSRFCDALLAKLLHNTSPFPLKQSTLQMATSPQAPASALATATVFTQDQQPIKGVAQRGLGWDLNSAFSRPRGEIFPITTAGHPGSFGHTGFTGTSLWLDPTSDTYVILLANAIHPRGNPPISPLRGAVATAAAKVLGLGTTTTPGAPGLASETWSSSEARPSSSTTPTKIVARPSSSTTPTKIVARPSSSDPSQKIVILSEVEGPAVAFRSSPTPPQNPVILSEAQSAQSKDPDALHPTKTAGTFLPTAFHPSADLPSATSAVFPPRPLRSALPSPPPANPTLTGIDVLERTHFAALKSITKSRPIRIALLTNQSGLDAQGNRTIDILLHADPQIKLVKLFTPEHGLSAKQDTDNLKTETDPTTNLPVISLYGAKSADRRPKPEDIKDLDAVVIDLQDMGVRFWTYEAALGYFLEATQCDGPAVIVLDRPNPIGGLAVQGNTSSTINYNSYMPLPVRHGITYGELARYFEAVQKPGEFVCADSNGLNPLRPPGSPAQVRPLPPPHLTVIPMQNWSREKFFADTHLPFTPPSPNMKTLAATILYPATGLIDQTNISVGRGTDTPYENIGAPWMTSPSAQELAAYLTARHIPGVTFTPTTLTIAETPEKYPGHGQTIPGIHFTVTDRATLDTPELGIELLSALHHLYPTQFQLEKASTLLANPATLAALKSGTDPREIAATWLPALQKFRADTAPYLLYK
jgi:SSS family transporter